MSRPKEGSGIGCLQGLHGRGDAPASPSTADRWNRASPPSSARLTIAAVPENARGRPPGHTWGSARQGTIYAVGGSRAWMSTAPPLTRKRAQIIRVISACRGGVYAVVDPVLRCLVRSPATGTPSLNRRQVANPRRQAHPPQ